MFKGMICKNFDDLILRGIILNYVYYLTLKILVIAITFLFMYNVIPTWPDFLWHIGDTSYVFIFAIYTIHLYEFLNVINIITSYSLGGGPTKR